MPTKHHRTVSDLLKGDLVVAQETDTIARAMEIMSQESIHHLPVVDGEGKLAGLVSDRDLLRALAGSMGRTDPIGAIMARGVVSVEPTAHAHAAAEVMLDAQIHCLPVTEKGGKLVGIITATDFLEVAEHALRGEPVAS